MSTPPPVDGPEPPKRAIALLAAAVITAGLVALSFYLGGWAYDTRTRTFHEGRLQQVVAKKATEPQVTAGLAAEGMREVGTARRAEDVVALADRWGGARRADVIAQASAAAITRVFASGDGRVFYFLYFDAAGTIVGFTFVSA